MILLALALAPAGPAGNALWAPQPAPAVEVAGSRPAGAAVAELEDFGLLSAEAGWLLMGQRLYWTATSGEVWTDITPPDLGSAFIQAVGFFDAQYGWLALTVPDAVGMPDEASAVTLALARTRDGGQTWQRISLVFFQPGEPEALADRVYLHFIDPQTGWLVVKRATSRNFSAGALFKTTDGGDTWTRLSLPIGEPVRFVTAEVGWTAGGAAGDELYRTVDGGAAWQAVSVDSLRLAEGERSVFRLPVFDTPDSGLLPVVVTAASGARLELHATQDGGQTWRLAGSAPVGPDVSTAAIPLAVLDSRRWVVVQPQAAQIAPDSSRAFSPANNIRELQMATPLAGWAKAVHGGCVTESGDSVACTTETWLLSTADGARTWRALRLPTGPDGETSLVTRSASEPLRPAAPIAALTRTQVVIGQGFDSCTLPGLGQMEDWILNSPYRVWNLYIGGSSRANCGTLTADYLAQLAVQGWRFIPTWVGPQAACSGFLSRMSFDPAVAYQQGVNEANLAVDTAAALGLTFSDKTGTILYYDLEAYSNNAACRDAAKAFISGWSGQVRARGDLAGVYGTPCTSYLSDFAGIANVPDTIWLAAWYLDGYDPGATVWLGSSAVCLSNSLWVNHQRIRQYAGGHNEAWGSSTLNIDSNVLDGVVADIRDLSGQTAQALELYQGSDYSGPAACTVDVEGWLNAEDCGLAWENQISSLKVRTGWSVRLYRDANLGGPSTCFVLSDPDLANDRFDASTPVDNQASSIWIFANAHCFDHFLYIPVINR